MNLKRRDSTEGTPEDSGNVPEQKPEDKSPKALKKREISVFIYTTVLFVAALLLILITYFIQEHRNSALADLTTQHGELTAQVLQNIEELQNRNENLRDELDQKEDELQTLQDELDAANRSIDALLAEQANLEQANEAASIEKQSLEKDLQNQRGKTEALGLLTALLATPEGEDVSGILAQLETQKGNLDAAYLNIYNAYIENMK